MPATPPEATTGATEAAIRADPLLGDAQKEALLAVYGSYVAEARRRDGADEASGTAGRCRPTPPSSRRSPARPARARRLRGAATTTHCPPARAGTPAAAIVLLGNAGGELWPAFSAGRRDEPHPLDEWARRTVGARSPRASTRRAVYPSDRPWHPFQQWAMRAEPVAPSPIGLLIHPDYGLWHAYRAALLLDEAPADLPPRVDRPVPCATCVGRPCLHACPVGAHSAAGFDVAACERHLRSDVAPHCMEVGCRSRDGCPVGRDSRSPDEQVAFHQRAFLSRGDEARATLGPSLGFPPCSRRALHGILRSTRGGPRNDLPRASPPPSLSSSPWRQLRTAAEKPVASARDARIIGGTAAPAGTWPFIASLRYSSNNEQFCGGSVITPTAILTAAHCVTDGAACTRRRRSYVVTGQTSLSATSGQRIRVARIIVHPTWTRPPGPATLRSSCWRRPPRPDHRHRQYDERGECPRRRGLGVDGGLGLAVALQSNNNDDAATWPDALQNAAPAHLHRRRLQRLLPEHDLLELAALRRPRGRDLLQRRSGGPHVVQTANGQWVYIGITSSTVLNQGWSCTYKYSGVTRTAPLFASMVAALRATPPRVLLSPATSSPPS